MSKLVQGFYKPNNPKKYIGNSSNIVFRSSWERMIYSWLDNSPAIIEWVSEEIVIPYFNPMDKQFHRYFPDAYFKVKTRTNIKECLAEIKPISHAQRPVIKPKQKTKSINIALERYVKNCVKWVAAQHYCSQKGWEFVLICEVPGTNRFARRDDILEIAIKDGNSLLTEGKFI